ncbi:thiol reductant ABC exporter subunit CydC [Rothia sp. P6271]|uniref:thiol reductant ABC exporter subunit CydC n=1 Tax=Rothia sp. P6271 TaxID=3402659 RepID=UPI003AD6AF34
MDKRPPLGPNATTNLGIFALITIIKTSATVLFAAVLGTAIAYMARLTYAAIHRNQIFTSDYDRQQAIFGGNAEAHLDGIWLATFGQKPTVMMLLLVAFIALVLRAASDWALSYFAQRAATGTKSTIRAQLIERVLATGGVDTPDGTGGTAVLISRGLDAIDDYYTKTLTALVSTAVTPIMILCVLGFYDLTSAIVIIATLPLIPVFMVLIGKTTKKDTEKAQQELLRLSDHIVELVKGLPVLVGLGRARAQSKALAELGERYRKTTVFTLRSAFLSSFWLELLTTISIAVIAVLIGVRLVHGNMGLDVALLALLLAPECYQPLRDVGSAYHQSEDGVAALRRAQSIIDRPLPEEKTFFDGEELSIQNVCVTYPGRSQVLHDVSFTVPHGSTVSITGPSGCGKSTLLGVINGAVADGLIPTGSRKPLQVSGEVRGTGSIVWVSQSPAFIATSVINEVALYGFPAVVDSEEDFAAVLKLLSETGPLSLSARGRERYRQYLRVVGLEDFADLAPESLSAGQMRRLAIARALARVDALERIGEKVTVLVDEPTAHLDAIASDRVNISLAALATTGATLLIVTHDEDLARRTDFRLDATTDERGTATSWTMSRSTSMGWDVESFKESLRQHSAENPQAAPEKKTQRPHSLTYRQPRGSVLQTLKDIRSLTGITFKQSLMPIILSALALSFSIMLTALSGWLIVRAAEQPAIMYLMVAIVGVRFFGLGRACTRYVERLRTHDLVLKAANFLRVRAWDSAGRTVLSLRSLLRGDRILNRLVGDIDELRDALPRVILPVGSHVTVMILAVVVTLSVAPIATPIVLCAAVISTLVIPALVRYTDHRADAIARFSTSELLRLGVSTLDAAADLRANGLNYLAAAAFKEKDQRNVESILAGSKASGFGHALTIVTWWGAAIGTIVITWAQVRSGELTGPLVAIILLMCTAMGESTAGHIEAVRGWPALAELVRRMRPLVETNSAEHTTTDVAQTRQRLGTPITLSMENVATRWPGMKEPVFTGLNASIRSGQWLGITGVSGAGKTTALATLLGFLPVENGAISVNGEQLSSEDLRGYAAWCPQSAYIFESSIANNLALAASAKNRPSEAEMYSVLDRVGLGDFVRSLPEGLNTPVGAGGSYVSGGQRQRIAIARTLLTQSPLLLMDEPTAHLDAPAARALIAEVSRGTKIDAATMKHVAQPGSGLQIPPAVVLVSHRRDDIEACDRIVELSP